ncbi:protein of unknown function [Acidithiobacillus ferrivorans]|uniref:Uncharacterized protein n=1 Tax=Acidithiobacillus ferrivorans TaxID=160808 RepID=A0A060ULI3_9PROT|nr:hypothetical protein AFERRI_240050 [Acidithiobacillus ferrivorans]SMH64883.1 protein of unknown function [Acidithiobacillus ferrivorans]
MPTLLQRLNGAPDKGAIPFPKIDKETKKCASSLTNLSSPHGKPIMPPSRMLPPPF